MIRFLLWPCRLAIGLLCANSLPAASLHWEQPEQRVDTSPTVEEINFSFAFVNESKNPVVLTETHASCGCTSPKIDNRTYAPGEKGSLIGHYKPGSRRGLSSVNISVKGNEIEGETRRPFEDKLKLTVFVPELVSIAPGITLWKKNADLLDKQVRLEIKQNDPLVIKFIELNNDAFTAKFSEITPGRNYELIVSPKSTTEPVQSIATFEATAPDGKPLRFFAHFMVR